MDDRVGCVMLLETLRRLKAQGTKSPNTIYFVGTVQEEVGLRGAHTAVEALKPDLGISPEAGIAADHPGGRPDSAQEKLGAGPVLYLAHGNFARAIGPPTNRHFSPERGATERPTHSYTVIVVPSSANTARAFFLPATFAK
jgi:hypothetical protein